MGKPDPHGLDLLFIATISHLSEPGVKEVACKSKGEALWKEPT